MEIDINMATKNYGEKRGIFNFDIHLEKGKVYGLVGTNGSGKTTTLRLLMGFIKPTDGSCKIKNMDCFKEAKEIKKYVSYVPGEINFPDVGLGEDFLKIEAQYEKITDYSRINRLIELFKLDVKTPLRRMSKGMKQKTALISCFMSDKEILLLDEPSTGLDPLMRDNLIELIKEEKEKGKTILMSSHIFKELERTCDTIIFIHNGKLIKEVSKEEYDDSLMRIEFNIQEEKKEFIKRNKIIDETEKEIIVSYEDINYLLNEIKNFEIKNISIIKTPLEVYYNKEIIGGYKDDFKSAIKTVI